MGPTPISAEIENFMGDADEILNSINIEDIRAKGLSLRVGNKLVDLTIAKEQLLPEYELKKEIAEIATAQMLKARTSLNEKILELRTAASQYRDDCEKREEEARQKISMANIMPDITYDHAVKGLSVVKGNLSYRNESDVFTWLYSGTYWPRYCGDKLIEPKFSVKLMSPVIIEIITVKNSVRQVIVKQIQGLGKFSHYHSVGGNEDCWGDWRPPSEWSTVDDIVAIGEQTCTVLEKINPNSLGRHNPRNLPRIDTVKNHLLDDTEPVKLPKVPREELRMGIDATTIDSDRSSVWTS